MDFLTSIQRTSRRLTDTVSNTLDDLLDDNENKRQQPGCELAAGKAVASGALLAGPAIDRLAGRRKLRALGLPPLLMALTLGADRRAS